LRRDIAPAVPSKADAEDILDRLRSRDFAPFHLQGIRSQSTPKQCPGDAQGLGWRKRSTVRTRKSHAKRVLPVTPPDPPWRGGSKCEDAIVVLRYDSGGTQNHYWVYTYGDSDRTPKLLGLFHAGDRAQYGLYQVFEKDRILNVRLFDPKFQEGDCCSSCYLNYQFRWNGAGFEAIGNPMPGRSDSMSRRPVSVIGLPLDQH
jgi:hypothetical protein